MAARADVSCRIASCRGRTSRYALRLVYPGRSYNVQRTTGNTLNRRETAETLSWTQRSPPLLRALARSVASTTSRLYARVRACFPPAFRCPAHRGDGQADRGWRYGPRRRRRRRRSRQRLEHARDQLRSVIARRRVARWRDISGRVRETFSRPLVARFSWKLSGESEIPEEKRRLPPSLPLCLTDPSLPTPPALINTIIFLGDHVRARYCSLVK